MNEYDKEFFSAGYTILTKKNPKFPKGFTYDMKRKLYNRVMEYYKNEENFEYCLQLSQSLNNIKDETNN